MSDTIEPPPPYAIPRPGVLKTLGICNIVFSILSVLCIGWSMMMYVVIARTNAAKSEVKVEAPEPPVKKAGVPMVVAFNPFMGFEDKAFMRFSLVENGISLAMNGLMFVTGIGLVNLKRWGARWWGALAWLRIVLAILVWGFYIVAVAPGFSETMAKDVAGQFASQGLPANRMPPVADLTRVYSIVNLIVAILAMGTISIYPAISIWLLGRPGVKAAIVDKPSVEQELP